MTTHQDDQWWHIFSNHDSRTEDICPAVPVHSGLAWQKGMVSLFCPCKSDPHAKECQLPLI